MAAGSFRLVDRAAREREEEALAPAATRSTASRGRAVPEAEDRLRTAFERDRDRILHAKAFRRLKHKTQVFLNPDGDHFVTRLTHTLQVTQVARSLARALGLNETLAEAIALGQVLDHAVEGAAESSGLGAQNMAPLHPREGLGLLRVGADDVDGLQQVLRQGHRGRGIQYHPRAGGPGEVDGGPHDVQWHLQLDQQHPRAGDALLRVHDVRETQTQVRTWRSQALPPALLIHHLQRHPGHLGGGSRHRADVHALPFELLQQREPARIHAHAAHQRHSRAQPRRAHGPDGALSSKALQEEVPPHAVPGTGQMGALHEEVRVDSADHDDVGLIARCHGAPPPPARSASRRATGSPGTTRACDSLQGTHSTSASQRKALSPLRARPACLGPPRWPAVKTLAGQRV